jgi:hypothetical protein
MKSALCCEVDLNIQAGNICWINGAFPAGTYSNLEIFWAGLMTYLEDFK